MNLITAQIAGDNFILHACGILETYNTVSFEKIITDHEIVGMVKRIGRGIEVNENTLAFSVIKEVGPQGQFLTQDHTFMNFRKEHYMPFISDRQNIRQWEESGSLSIAQKANAKWKQILEDYEQPDFPAELDNDLKKMIQK